MGHYLILMKIGIVGAGPAGLFAAYELSEKVDVTIIDKGPDAEERIKSSSNILFGVGGAGLFSDGKLNFSPEIGNNLTDLINLKEIENLVKKVEEIFSFYDIKAKEMDEEKVKALETQAAHSGMKYLPVRQAHVGSDHLPYFIKEISKDLKKRGVEFLCNSEVNDLNQGEIFIDKDKYKFDKILLAPGRSGARWLEGIVKGKNMNYIYNPIDIGVRVEVPAIIMEEICGVNWDPKVHIRTPAYDDFVRTFCVSPYGYVVKEVFDNFCLVNGHSRKDFRSSNTNFAFLIKVKLTEPLENTNLYGESIALQATTIGGHKPILQRLGDLRVGRRSTWGRLEKSYVLPTLKDVTPGDIAMAMPYRFVKDILEGLEILDRLIPGVADNSTLIYATEIKFHGLRVITDKNLQTSLSGIYVAGDGAGLSRGIVGSAASGILAAQGILKN
ncbi:MAG: FAD-dependent protein [Acidobacteriota bacterium]